jgi:catechol 2,3-dioxygenase-like lactoylglutathione lyase family enzyme
VDDARVHGAMIDRIDHLVLTVRSADATCAFYEDVLGFRRVEAEGRPVALVSGRQKINVHELGQSFEPRAVAPTPGSGDFCLITERPLDEVCDHLARHGIAIELGPIARQGAEGTMTSIYLRDPDGNLVEISRY